MPCGCLFVQMDCGEAQAFGSVECCAAVAAWCLRGEGAPVWGEQREPSTLLLELLENCG